MQVLIPESLETLVHHCNFLLNFETSPATESVFTCTAPLQPTGTIIHLLSVTLLILCYTLITRNYIKTCKQLEQIL